MSKYVEWNEPYCNKPQVNAIIRILAEDAIKIQRQKSIDLRGYDVYNNDNTALDDFVICSWGKILEIKD